ncbi:hypothetical protein J132_05733 [Termitomyces sp. J132]|nr:hypothetical protein J132_05733 [Termitomyces sp. J132]
MTPSQPSASTASSSSSKTIKTIIQGTYPTLAVHRGAIDQTMITTGSPPEAMKRILSVLETMGIVVEAEHEYRYRCTRPRRHTDFEDLGMVTVSGNDYSKSIMSRTRPSEVLETPYPRRNVDSGLEDDFERSFTANLVSTCLQVPWTNLRRHHPTSLSSSLDSDVGLLHAPPNNNSIAYGPRSEDPGEEVRFTAELTRLENLDTTYSLDIRRLKGNLRSYKFLYDTLRERTDLQATT